MDRGHESVSATVGRLSGAEGAELAGLVERLTEPHILALLSDSQRLEVIAASARVESWSTAMRARAIGVLHDSVMSEVCDDPADPDVREHQLADRQVAMEVSLVMGVSFVVADRELDLAVDLRACPRAGRALARGEIDRRQAQVVLDGLRQVDDASPADHPQRATHRAELINGLFGVERDAAESAGAVGAAVGADDERFRELARPGVTLWSLPPAKLRAIIDREVARLDPDYLATRAEAARAERRLDYQDHSDATSSLHLQTSTEHAAAAYRNVDDAARSARRLGDPRNLDQLRADITVGWLTEGAYGTVVVRPTPPSAQPAAQPSAQPAAQPSAQPAAQPSARPEPLSLPRSDSPLVHVTVAATTLLGADQEPATLHGPRGRSRSQPTWPESWPVDAERAGDGCCTTRTPALPPISPRSTDRAPSPMRSSAPGTATARASRPAARPGWSWTTSVSTGTTTRRPAVRPARTTSWPRASATTSSRPTGWSR